MKVINARYCSKYSNISPGNISHSLCCKIYRIDIDPSSFAGKNVSSRRRLQTKVTYRTVLEILS